MDVQSDLNDGLGSSCNGEENTTIAEAEMEKKCQKHKSWWALEQGLDFISIGSTSEGQF